MNNVESDIILSCECREPEGKIMRHVRLAKLTVEKIGFYWEKMKDFDLLFNDFVRGDFPAFVNHFVVQVNGEPFPAGLIWEVDDIGIIIVNEIIPAVSAQAHFVFWDKRTRGREELCRKMLEYGFNKYKFARIEVQVPLCASIVMQMVERIGFSLEGRKRDATRYNGEWFDVNIYSMIPWDLKGSLSYTNNKNESSLICLECRSKFKKNRVSKPKELVIHGT